MRQFHNTDVHFCGLRLGKPTVAPFTFVVA